MIQLSESSSVDGVAGTGDTFTERYWTVRRQNLNENRRLENAGATEALGDNSQTAMRLDAMRQASFVQRYATTLCRVCSRNWDA
jgi:hypothetical protein